MGCGVPPAHPACANCHATPFCHARPFKSKREAHQRWRRGGLSVESYKGIARACGDAVRKAKAWLELILAVEVKNNKKGFFRYVNHKQKKKENIGPLLNRRVSR